MSRRWLETFKEDPASWYIHLEIETPVERFLQKWESREPMGNEQYLATGATAR